MDVVGIIDRRQLDQSPGSYTPAWRFPYCVARSGAIGFTVRRFPQCFASDESWFAINCFAAKRMPRSVAAAGRNRHRGRCSLPLKTYAERDDFY